MQDWQPLIRDAMARISGYVRRTPTLEVDASALGASRPVTLKLEQLQHTGSFKPRGAFNRILSCRQGDLGGDPSAVIAASGGNHGIATAYAAQQLGLPADIFVPEISSPVKIARIRALGATAHVGGARYQDALEASEAFAAAQEALVVHAYDQPEVIAGQGTCGLELSEQAPDLDTVLVAVGGGGFIGGIAGWYAGGTRVVAVEPATSRALDAALEAGHPVDVEVSGRAADSLGARSAGTLMFEIARTHVADSVLVADQAIADAQDWLWNELRLATEPGGATALAALLSGAFQPAPDERLGILVCGGNVDPKTLS